MLKHISKFINRFLLRKKDVNSELEQLRYLSQSILIEETKVPYTTRIILLIISVAITLIIIWAALTQINEIVITYGEVIPKQHVQIVQHLEGGIVSEIKVNEGDLVKDGQPLITIDGSALKQDLSAMIARKVSLEYQALRLRSFINNTVPDFYQVETNSIDDEAIKGQMSIFESMVKNRTQEKDVIIEQIHQKEASLASLLDKQEIIDEKMNLIKEELELKKQLHEKGYLGKLKFLQIQKEFNDIKGILKENNAEIIQARNSISEFKNRLESFEANFIDESYRELDIVERNITQIEKNIKKLQDQIDRLTVVSPIYGFVKALNVKTIGGVIESGEILAEIVPLEGNLIVEIKIPPKSIGYMKIGQAVNVKITAYDFSKYGKMDGTLEYISATTFTDRYDAKYYIGRVLINKNYIGSNPEQNIVLPGMTVQADIVTGGKSILAYLLNPIHSSVTAAFSKR